MKNSADSSQDSAMNNTSQLARMLLLVAIMAVLTLTVLFFAGKLPHQKLTAQEFINLQEGDNPHAGFRRAHAKGICIFGNFESNGNLASYSTANIFHIREIHGYAATLFFLMIFMHVGAALYHGLVRRDGVFSSMVSGK